ncbi:MAG: hypothetical protein QGD88_09205 [Anaerolineae bacterium]|nr:hypothetical protein [Anaerolineae bacterium]
MNTNKLLSTFVLIIVLALVFSACGGEQALTEQQELSTIVATTLTAMPSEPQAEIPAPAGDMQPLPTAECEALAIEMGQSLALTISNETVPVERSWSGETGSACQLIGLGNGNNFKSIFEPSDAVKGKLESRGWSNSSQLPCLGHGGAGPSADQSCYVNENKTCEIMVTLEPIDISLCDGVDGPIGECFGILTPEQLVYSIRLTCAQGKISLPLQINQPERIEFAAGATSSQVQAKLVRGNPHQYVLAASQGQEMTVILNASGAATLSIWGLDGTILISDLSASSSWTGLLPLSQDYFIEVFSPGEGIIDYSLEVTIPSAQTITSGQVFPRVEPFSFGHMQAIAIYSVPPMLPPEFPVEAGQPEIVPFEISEFPGAYEFSLDYGIDCEGAGACHYGIIAGMQTTALIPVGTSNLPFEAGLAEQVTLANNISGFFVDYACGASCSDATVWWIYGGYQYMLGLKAGPRDTVIALANAAITNSIP